MGAWGGLATEQPLFSFYFVAAFLAYWDTLCSLFLVENKNNEGKAVGNYPMSCGKFVENGFSF